MKKVNKVDTYKPFETLEEMAEALDELYSRPQQYSGTTVCGKIWKDTERHTIVTCDYDNCKTCKDFNNALIEHYNG